MCNMKITVLGCRGSVPTGAKEFSKYGSDTSCYLVETDTQAVFLDAGTGIVKAPDIGNRKISLVFSHFHLDHIMGLTFFPYLSKECDISIYGGGNAMEAGATLDLIFAPPFWPARLGEYPSNLSFFGASGEWDVGDIHFKAIPGNHPDGAMIFRITSGKASFVYATDYEYTDRDLDRISEFSKDTDLIIYDGQYTKEQADKFKGYGHSTKESGLKVLEHSGAKQILFTHHDPRHNDVFLDRESSRISDLCKDAFLAYPGKVIEL